MTCDCNKKIFTPQGWFDDISGNITDLSSNLISMDGSVLGNISSGLQNLLSPVAAQIIDIPDTATKLIQDVQWVGLKSPQDFSLDTLGYQMDLFSKVAPGIFDVNVQPMGDVCDDGFAADVGQCKACLFGLGLSGKWALTNVETQKLSKCVRDQGLTPGVSGIEFPIYVNKQVSIFPDTTLESFGKMTFNPSFAPDYGLPPISVSPFSLWGIFNI